MSYNQEVSYSSYSLLRMPNLMGDTPHTHSGIAGGKLLTKLEKDDNDLKMWGGWIDGCMGGWITEQSDF